MRCRSGLLEIYQHADLGWRSAFSAADNFAPPFHDVDYNPRSVGATGRGNLIGSAKEKQDGEQGNYGGRISVKSINPAVWRFFGCLFCLVALFSLGFFAVNAVLEGHYLLFGIILIPMYVGVICFFWLLPL